MKNALALASLTVIGLIVCVGNHKAYALSYTDIQGTTTDTVTLSAYPTTTSSLSGTISVDSSYLSFTNTADATLSVSSYPAITLTTSVMPTYTSGDIVLVSAYPSSQLFTSNTTTYPIDSQPVSVLSNTTTSTRSNPQPTYYYGPPQLVSSSPTGGSGISGSAYKFAATISDPNDLVRNVRFKFFDTNRNLLLDSTSNLNLEGKWIANNIFDSTKYHDGYGYAIEISTEGSSAGSVSGTGYTLSWNNVYFGIDNIKSTEVSTNPDAGGSTIINKEFVATSYTSHSDGEIPIMSTNVQFYFVDSQGDRLPQGALWTMAKDHISYLGVWSTASLDSKTLFAKGNGRYIAVFKSVYEDGAITTTEAPFEVYNSDDVTPPAKPKLVSPTNGITMLPGKITYKWSGNEGDDITGFNFESGDIDPLSGTFEGRSGGYSDSRDGSFTWTEDSITPLAATKVSWRLQVRDRAGNWSAWSNASSYTIDPHYVPDTTPPPKPILLSPINNQNVNASKVIQSWRSDANDIDYYTYESYNDPQRKNLVTQERVSSSTRTTLNQPNGALWWRIQAVDKAGNKSQWSDLSKMTVSNVTIKR